MQAQILISGLILASGLVAVATSARAAVTYDEARVLDSTPIYRVVESSSPRERGMGETGERGMGWSGERNRSASNSDRRGGITNRDLDTEQREQDQLPERGRSKSDSEC